MRVVRAENFTVETHSANSQPSSVHEGGPKADRTAKAVKVAAASGKRGRTGLQPSVPGRSLGSGEIANIFEGVITMKLGGIATLKQLQGMLKDHKNYSEFHKKAKLCHGIPPKDGQQSAPARWDPTWFALCALELGRAFESELDSLFKMNPALSDWRKAWQEHKPTQFRKPSPS